MIYIDCTSTSTVCAELHTGIQRVVRQILHHRPLGIPTQAVVATAAGFQATDPSGQQTDGTAIRFTPQDTLLLLDASWDLLPYWHYLKAADKAGSRLVFLAYDLIPLTHSAYCDAGHVALFKDYITRAVDLADGFIGISRSSRDEIRAYACQYNPGRFKDINFDYFHLGADFPQKRSPDADIRSEFYDFFECPEPVFLLVSTIEPRKGHARLLNAMEQLWDEGHIARLCFIGRVGWCVDDFVAYLYKHTKYGKQMVTWHDSSDNELAYAYQKARALVFPSVAEGFGLPLVEALQHRLPVIASDIPAHREIGGEVVRFVSPSDTAELVAALKQFSGASVPRMYQPQETYRWLSWQESSKMLFSSEILYNK